MSLTEYIETYRPKSVTPRLWRGTPPEILKRHLDSLFWRLSGYRAMVDLPIEQVKQFLYSDAEVDRLTPSVTCDDCGDVIDRLYRCRCN